MVYNTQPNLFLSDCESKVTPKNEIRIKVKIRVVFSAKTSQVGILSQ